mgnify:CR=1 FL=1
MAGSAGTRTTKSLIKEELMDDEVFSVIIKAIERAFDPKFQQLNEKLDRQDGTIHDLQCKVENIEHELQQVQKRQQSCEEKS